MVRVRGGVAAVVAAGGGDVARSAVVVSDAHSAWSKSSPLQRRRPGGAAVPEVSEARELQLQAWQWARANRASDGSLPSGKAVARQCGRHERWGRLVKLAWRERSQLTVKPSNDPLKINQHGYLASNRLTQGPTARVPTWVLLSVYILSQERLHLVQLPTRVRR